MRELINHKVNGLNEALRIEVTDGPGQGNACHKYRVTPMTGNAKGLLIECQNGPLQETVYPTGLSNEVLLAIVEDRLIGFQSGEFACRENAQALLKLQQALRWLNRRTRDRVSRRVEGTNTK